jgi:hypothetical protein
VEDTFEAVDWMSWRTLIIDLGWSWDNTEQWLAPRGVEALLKPKAPSRRP